jgi:hypothetical protein
MKKTVILFPAMFAALFLFQCTKESGDMDVTDKSDGTPGLYSGFGEGLSSGGSSSGLGTGDSTQQEPVNPGQITAAEWNDLAEWEFWNNLGQNDEFNQAQENWMFYPKMRYSFLVRDNRFNPLADCEIMLKNLQGEILWKTRTDNEGKAELWLDLNGGNTGQVTATVRYSDQQITVVDPDSYENGINEVTIPLQAQVNLKRIFCLLWMPQDPWGMKLTT